MAQPPKSTTLAEHGVIGISDTLTPAHGVATPVYVKAKVEEAREASLAEAVKAKVASWIGAGILSGVTLGAVAYAYETLESKAKDAGTAAAQVQIATVDAGLKGVEARLTVVEQQRTSDRAEFNARFERLENQGNRAEKKLDALIDAAGVRNPAPTPKDGGR